MADLFRPCPVCDNPIGEILHKQSFTLPSNSPLPANYEIVTCLKCGFVFADAIANQTIYNTYYTLLSKYEDLEISSGSGVGQYDYQRLELTASTIQRLLPDLSASILDMGCANGGLLSALKQIGYYNIMGIDPSRSCTNHVNKLEIRCIQGDIFSDSFKQLPNKFDMIILTHVLEHIYDLSTAIFNLSDKLNDVGLLYIEVPDASRYSEFSIVPYYFIDCEHINHFDVDSLTNLVSTRGFNQIESRNFEFKVNDKNSYPSVYSIFEKTLQKVAKTLNFSDKSKKSFLRFIEQSKNSNINDIVIQNLVENQKPILIWGAGQFTLRLLANSELAKCNIEGFIDSDSNKQDKEIMCHSVYSPDYLKNKDIAVVICSALHSHEIKNQIKELNPNAEIYIMK